MSDVKTTVVVAPRIGLWLVESSRGHTVSVWGTRPEVSEHGHLEFSGGEIFARNEWSNVTPAPDKELHKKVVVEMLLDRVLPDAVVTYLNDYLEELKGGEADG